MTELVDPPPAARQVSLRGILLGITHVSILLGLFRLLPQPEEIAVPQFAVGGLFASLILAATAAVAHRSRIQTTLFAAWLGTVGGGTAATVLLMSWYLPGDAWRMTFITVPLASLFAFWLFAAGGLLGIAAVGIVAPFVNVPQRRWAGPVCGGITGAILFAVAFGPLGEPFLLVAPLLGGYACGVFAHYTVSLLPPMANDPDATI